MAAIVDYNGVLGTFDCGFEGARTNTFQIIGTEGQITLDNAFDPAPGESVRVTVSLRTGQTEVLDNTEDHFKVEIGRFSSILARGHAAGIVNRQLTEQNLAVRLAVHESLATGLPCKVRTSEGG